MEALANKEVDLLNKKYDDQQNKQQEIFEKELTNEISKIEQRPDA